MYCVCWNEYFVLLTTLCPWPAAYFYTSCPSVVAANIAPIMMVFFVEDVLLFASVSQRWDRKRSWGESWEAFSSMHSGSWMIVSACIRLVTALCRVSLVWMSAPLLQLNLPYTVVVKLPACRIVPVQMMWALLRLIWSLHHRRCLLWNVQQVKSRFMMQFHVSVSKKALLQSVWSQLLCRCYFGACVFYVTAAWALLQGRGPLWKELLSLTSWFFLAEWKLAKHGSANMKRNFLAQRPARLLG